MNITKALNLNRKQQSVNSRSVLFSKHTIPINVRRFYTDVDGQIIDKSTVPAALQVRYPVFLLGEFDRNGGYSIGRKVISPEPGTFYLQTFVNGNGNTSINICNNSGLNEIQGYMNFGDVVTVYTDSLNSPGYYIWLIVSTQPVSMASILANSQTTQRDKRLGKLAVYEVNYQVSDASQFTEDLNITTYDNIGNYQNNQLQPLGIYRSIMDRQTNFITLKLTFDINQFLGINTYMLYDADFFTLNLKTAII